MVAVLAFLPAAVPGSTEEGILRERTLLTSPNDRLREPEVRRSFLLAGERRCSMSFLSNGDDRDASPAFGSDSRAARAGARAVRVAGPPRPGAPGAPSRLRELGDGGILQELKQVRYVDQFVLALSRTNRGAVSRSPRPPPLASRGRPIVWIDGPRISKLFQSLEEQGLFIGPDGKGRSCWMAYGYVLAVGRARVMALHDCDIVNYQRYMLARLCYPVMNPNLPFEFCKGYYARLSDRVARTRDPAAPDASHPLAERALRKHPVPSLYRQLPLRSRGRVRDARRPRAGKPHPFRLGTRSRGPRGDLPQLLT